jgi:hypothetical protein
MNKSLLLASIAIAVFLFSGCATKPIMPTGTFADGESANGQAYTVWAFTPQDGMFTSDATHLNNTIVHPLQIAAEDAIANGFKYFVIMRPDAIANTNGIMINSVAEYAEKCANNNILKSLIVLTNPCNIALFDSKYPIAGRLMVHMYKEQPSAFISYDASSVITDLKAKGMYYDKPRYKGQGEWNPEGKFMLLKSGGNN